MNKFPYRVVVRTTRRWFRKPKRTLVIQKLGRGMVYPGWVQDVWYDCTDEDYVDVMMDVFFYHYQKPKN